MFPTRALRKRWVLTVIFLLSFVYFVTNIFNQSDPFILQEDSIQPEVKRTFRWKSHHETKNSTVLTTCRNSVQGRVHIADEKGYLCERADVLANGCCDSTAEKTVLYCCDSCLDNGCCSLYEHCVSCCLQPQKQQLLQAVLGRASKAFQILFSSVTDHFELCLAKCRTSSESVQHENTYRDPEAKYCYGDNPPELQPPN
ncbi:SREBP regulating gene protein-like [Ptychodera flava]|uniref:SREBP regulating gene protein-like n=1 Tax=Ptychodera flava TaxID=63121 RepID=UPI00396A7044